MPSPYSGKVFAFDHNWNDPVTERLSWLTSVLRKRDGSEQRIRLRHRPRRLLEYTALVGGADELDMRRRFDALVWAGQSEEVMVPFWPDAFTLGAQLNSGSSTVSVAAGLLQFNGRDIDNADSYLMFWRDYKTYEVVKITSLTFNIDFHIISFETNTVSTWPKGTIVIPARRCLYEPSISGNVFASDIQSLKVRFQIITPTVGPTQGRRSATPSSDTYRSTDVLADPGMDGTNTRTLERGVTPIDFQVGQFTTDTVQPAPFGGLDINVSLEGRAEIADFLGWLNIRQGRQKAFWLPTWEQDFEDVTPDEIEADVFAALGFGYTAAYNLAESRRDIAFINPDSSMDYRRIILSEVDGDNEVFQVDSALPDPLTPERTSFLRYCRLDQDDIDLTWMTTDDVVTSLKVRELIKTA